MIDDFSKSIEIATQLRQNGINTQVYTDKIKVKNQFKYANKLNIPYVIILGEDEVKENKIALKSMQNGDQVITTIDEAIDYLKNN